MAAIFTSVQSQSRGNVKPNPSGNNDDGILGNLIRGLVGNGGNENGVLGKLIEGLVGRQ